VLKEALSEETVCRTDRETERACVYECVFDYESMNFVGRKDN